MFFFTMSWADGGSAHVWGYLKERTEFQPEASTPWLRQEQHSTELSGDPVRGPPVT
jgi:hypothetical protein